MGRSARFNGHVAERDFPQETGEKLASGGRLCYNGFISYRPGARPGFRRKEGRRMLTDIEIAQQAHMLPITEVAVLVLCAVLWKRQDVGRTAVRGHA